MGSRALQGFLSYRAKRRGGVWWFFLLGAVLAVIMGATAVPIYSAAVVLIMCNCGWAGTGLTVLQDTKDRNQSIDFLLLPLDNHDWRRVLQRYFFLGFFVTLGQFAVYALSLWYFDPSTWVEFLRLNQPATVRGFRILFHSYVVAIVIGFFWAGYWSVLWRGWPLVLTATFPLWILGAGVLSVYGVLPFRTTLPALALVQLLFGFLVRHWVGKAWLLRASSILLSK